MIIDAHTHMPSEGWPGYASWFATVDKAVAYLKAAGTDAAFFNTFQGVFAETEDDLDRGNAVALELADRYAGFLYPGACIHPAFPEASRRWLARFRERGIFWVGELVNYRKVYHYTDESFLALAAECAAHGHILQVHVQNEVYDLASRFPELPIVCSHINAELCRRLAGLPNTWVDISGSVGGLHLGGIEAACDAMGADRLLFGTDFTLYEPRSFQERLRMAVPHPEEREKILCGNILRLLERAGSRRPPGAPCGDHPMTSAPPRGSRSSIESDDAVSQPTC
jgi:predicted TIM-barrel fold metal-dependent hydrolase